MNRRIGIAAAVVVSMLLSPAWAMAEETKSLRDVIFYSLTNNRTILFEQNQRVGQKAELKLAEDKFTPKVNLVSAYRLTRILLENQQAADNDSWSRVASIGPEMSLILPTGAKVEAAVLGKHVNDEDRWNSDEVDDLALALTVRQPLLKGAGFQINNASIEQARFQEEANKLTLKALSNQAITSVIFAYRDVIRAKLALRIAERNVLRSKDLLNGTRALIAAGRLAAADITLSETSLYQKQIALADAQAQLEKARATLLKTMGADLAGDIDVSTEMDAGNVNLVLADAIENARQNNPVIAAQKYLIERTAKDVELAENDRLWDLSLIGGVGYGNVNGRINGRNERTEIVAGMELVIPFNDLASETREITAKTALKGARIQLAEIEAQVELDVRNAVTDVKSKWGQYELARRARASAEQTLADAVRRLSIGRASNFEVQSLQDDLNQTELNELDAMIAYQNALTDLDLRQGTTLDTWGISL